MSQQKPSIVLGLPGMTLNETIFPDFGLPTVGVDFNELLLSTDGSLPADADPMGAYLAALRGRLDKCPPWRTASRRLVVGHSFGGMLALRWLVDAIDTDLPIHGLVLIATTAGPMYDAVSLRLARIGSADLRIPIAFAMRWWNTSAVTRTVKRLLTGGVLTANRVDFRTLDLRGDLAVDIAGWQNTDWRAMRSYRFAMEGFDVRDRLGDIPVPAIVLHGNGDALFPPSVGADLAAALPNAEFREIDGASHILPLTHPEAVVRAVRDLRDR